MEINKSNFVFFGEEGISMSEANHLANMAKETGENVSRKLSSIAATHDKLTWEEGKELDLDKNKVIDYPELEKLAVREGQIYMLSAWFREAVRAKTDLLSQYRTVDGQHFMLDTEKFPNAEIERPTVVFPQVPAELTEKDVIGEMNIKQRADYLATEAIAAHLGKKLHKDGVFSKLRIAIASFVPVWFREMSNGVGKKSYPVQSTLLYTENEFDTFYFKMQDQYRAAERKLNAIKASIQNEVTVRNSTAQKEYSAAYAKASVEYDNAMSDYNQKVKALQNEQKAFIHMLESRRLDRVKEVSGWKIVVPEALKDVYEEIAGLGK